MKKDNTWDREAKKQAISKAYYLVQDEARRCGLMKLVNNKDIFNDIESELVKLKAEYKKPENVRVVTNFAKKDEDSDN